MRDYVSPGSALQDFTIISHPWFACSSWVIFWLWGYLCAWVLGCHGRRVGPTLLHFSHQPAGVSSASALGLPDYKRFEEAPACGGWGWWWEWVGGGTSASGAGGKYCYRFWGPDMELLNHIPSWQWNCWCLRPGELACRDSPVRL